MPLFPNLFASQPFKALYVLGALFLNLCKLPFWILRYAFVRQHPSWTFRQALGMRITRAFVSTFSTIRIHDPLPLTPDKEGERFVVIKTREEDGKRFKGPMLASAAHVQPVDIGGTWYPARLTASEVSKSTGEGEGKGKDEKKDLLVILHIHGGAYVIGDGRTASSGSFAQSLLMHTAATHVFCPQYRLSRLPASPSSNPFPAALQDALTAYLYLLEELHIPPANIVLSGDSAGANCAIALLRYIVAYGAELSLPHPSAALLWSPWINPTDASASFVHTNPHYASDYLDPAFTGWGVHALAGQDPPLKGPSALAANPYVNAKESGFRTPVPLFVNVGGKEVLFFDGREWAKMMEKEGNEVEFDATDGACHDVLLVAGLVGMERQADEMGKRAGEWLQRVRT